MSIIIPANSAAAGGGFNVANSCMFNTATESKMEITFGSAGTSLRKATFSSWLKRSNLTVDEELIFRVTADSGYFNIAFSSGDELKIKQSISSTVNLEFESTQRFRDPSAWLHMLVVFDTTQSTEANRVKIYINGTQVTSWSTSTYPDQNTDMLFGTANLNIIGSAGSGNFFGGYLAEMCYCDGQSLTPTSFGEFDEDSGIWKPIDVSGLTFGTNGFYLDFEDSANLGNDANGGTDLSETNLAATNQSTDTCTNNFATLNPLNAFYTSSTFTDGNTTFASGSSYTGTKANILLNTGKWYWEVKVISKTGDSDNYTIGIQGQESTATNQFPGLPATGYAIYGVNGQIYNNNSGSTYAAAYAAGDIIGVALDLTNYKLYFSKDGAWSTGSGAWDSSTFDADVGDKDITAPASTPLGGYYPSQTFWSGSGATFSMNFGSPYFAISSGNADGDGFGNFEYAVPSGYFALCTKNLAEYG